MTDPVTAPVAATITLRVAEARVEDIAHAIARLAPVDLERIGARPRRHPEDHRADRRRGARRGVGMRRTKGSSRSTAPRAATAAPVLDEQVSAAIVESAQAVAVRLTPLWAGAAPAIIAPERMLEDLVGRPGHLRLRRARADVRQGGELPGGADDSGRTGRHRQAPRDIRVVEGEPTAARAPAVSYEDIGGLEREVARGARDGRAAAEAFASLRAAGDSRTEGACCCTVRPAPARPLLARAVAAESRVHFIHLNGPEIMRKFYGESEAKLREVFEEAARRAPSILFIDEIDAVAPKRAEVVGDVEKRVVAQLLSLMDGFVSRGQVIVIGATNIPEVLDPALRRPGRFDREIEIGVPNTQGRLQILKIHTRAMPLWPDVNLQEIAEHSHGFVGADVEALCQEVGMIALRRFLSSARTSRTRRSTSRSTDLTALQVTRDDFLAGLKEVEPSATREFFLEKSTTTFESLGGLSAVKHLLHSVIEHSHVHDEIYEQVGLAPPRGILLVGPSGTGKTAMARALSGEKQIPLIAIDGPQLYSKWLGESEKAPPRGVQEGEAGGAVPAVLRHDRCGGAAAERRPVRHRRLPAHSEPAAARDRQPARRQGRDSGCATNRPERVEPGALAKRTVRLYRSVRRAGHRGPGGHLSTLLPEDPARAGHRCRAARAPNRRLHRRGHRKPVQEGDAAGHRRISRRRGWPVVRRAETRFRCGVGSAGQAGHCLSRTDDFERFDHGVHRAHCLDARHHHGQEGRDIINSVAASARLEGKFAQAMENYVDNPDRTNAPTRKYCRVSDSEIENALTYENEHPNIVVLVEETMVKGWDYMRGMPPGGTLIINTHYTPEYMIRFVPGSGAARAARVRRLPRSWPITNGCTTGSASWASTGCPRKARPSATRRFAPDIAAALIAAVVKTHRHRQARDDRANDREQGRVPHGARIVAYHAARGSSRVVGKFVSWYIGKWNYQLTN